MARNVTTRNWDEAGKMFEFTVPKNLEENINNAVEEVQRIYSDSILEVLQEQPSDWTEKSKEWQRKSGNKELYFGEQGDFFVAVTSGNNKRGIRAKKGDKRVFVGARHDIAHHSGYSMETLAEILASVPDGSRDLFGRAYERVEDHIHRVFREVGIDIE